ncbi:MAG: ABC transporter ATP-binding protein [Roseomonas sp.]|nr:ABC transporter ATP-binding protein [Roseomonas sp.]
MQHADPAPLLDIRGLSVALGAAGRRVPVVEDLSISLPAGRVLCVVGESGSGKSVTALAAMGLLEPGRSAVTADRMALDGIDLLALDEGGWRALRGGRMAMVFQEPMTSLNPVFTIGEQIVEALRVHTGLPRQAARSRALEALREVGISAPETRLDAYPHELSGGMRQRAMIAMALVGEPALLIADEPTTALDVTVQAQILALLADLRDRRRMAILLITHNLGVVAETADEVAVMYAGRIVERAPATSLFRDAQHPYTLALLGAMPESAARGQPLSPIPGRMPAPGSAPPGCRFAPRCPFAGPDCAETPPLREIAQGHAVACHRAPVEYVA